MASNWRVLGKSEDVLTCECCGKANLKLTVILTNGEGEVYFGRDCAARKTGIRRSGAGMETLAREAQRVADEKKAMTPVRCGEGEALFVVESIGNNGGKLTRLCFAVGGGHHAVAAYAEKTFPGHEINVRRAR